MLMVALMLNTMVWRKATMVAESSGTKSKPMFARKEDRMCE